MFFDENFGSESIIMNVIYNKLIYQKKPNSFGLCFPRVYTFSDKSNLSLRVQMVTKYEVNCAEFSCHLNSNNSLICILHKPHGGKAIFWLLQSWKTKVDKNQRIWIKLNKIWSPTEVTLT